ncbi:MAG: chemotaxis protein CheD [Wujia sp.]
MGETIRVGIADMKTCSAPDKITTIGLGSCIGIVLYDETKKKAGLVHIMLPDSTKIKQNQNKLKFADTGIDQLIGELEKEGVNKASLRAKIAGGARMFNFSSSTEAGSVGDKNIAAVREQLKKNGIRIVSEDVGLNYGRTIIFDPETSELTVIKAGKQKNVI